MYFWHIHMHIHTYIYTPCQNVCTYLRKGGWISRTWFLYLDCYKFDSCHNPLGKSVAQGLSSLQKTKPEKKAFPISLIRFKKKIMERGNMKNTCIKTYMLNKSKCILVSSKGSPRFEIIQTLHNDRPLTTSAERWREVVG